MADPFFAPIHENECLFLRRVWRDYVDLATAAKIHAAGAA
jgi:hypothetical protein